MSIPKAVRDAVRDRAGGCCELCGAQANNQHHRRNKSQGGLDVPANLMLLCGSGVTGCHGWVTRNPDMAEPLGYTIKGTVATASAVRVCLYTRTDLRRDEWVYLGAQGDYLDGPPCCCAVDYSVRCFRCVLGSHHMCEKPSDGSVTDHVKETA